MAQSSYTLSDALGAIFRAALNTLMGAVKSRNSGNSAPSDPVQGMVYVKTVSATVQEVYEHDGGAWVLRYVINPTTHQFRSIDGSRRAWGGDAGGTADALTWSTSPAIAAYEDGQTFAVYTGAAPNTGAMTGNADGQGVKSIKINGVDPAAGDVPANSLLVLRYRSNILHVVGGALPRATTARYGNMLLDNEAGFLAGTAGKVPPSDVVKKHARERLYADRTYYVRTDGSDANNGLANTSGGAFLTIQKAANVIRDTLDFNGFTVTVQIGDGTYTAGMLLRGKCVGQRDWTSLVFQGNAATPANVVISVTGGDCFKAWGGAQFTIKDVKVQTTTSGDCVEAFLPGSVIVLFRLNFGACAGAHIRAFGNCYISCEAGEPYTISGGAQYHLRAVQLGQIECDAGTVTISGTPAFSVAFAGASLQGLIFVLSSSVSFSGSATGKRYDAAQNSVIDTQGAAATYLPGNASGTTATGGQYT